MNLSFRGGTVEYSGKSNILSGSVKDGEISNFQNDSQLIQVEASDQPSKNTKM